MDIGGRLLDELRPGQLMLILGRPGSGVSTTLASICLAAAITGRPTLLASWESSPECTRARTGPNDLLNLPNIIGWDLHGLSHYAAEGLEIGSLVGVDYLQLVAGTGSARERIDDVRAWGKKRDLRIALGVMVPRQFGSARSEKSGTLVSMLDLLTPYWEACDSLLFIDPPGPPARSASLLRPETDGCWTTCFTQPIGGDHSSGSTP